ncbi:MAG TPA: hypothetical protein VGQ35_11525 [Dongiaceae bacterium]|jgi:hypothetical protein|nr:hypothetical protein [Dongiaceae bacterium]
MSYTREREQSRLSEVAETPLGVAHLAERVREATRQAALEGVRSALSAVTEQSPALPEVIRDIADRAVARVAIMQAELDRFLVATRGYRRADGAWISPAAKRDKTAGNAVVTCIALEKHRTKCHGRFFHHTIFR